MSERRPISINRLLLVLLAVLGLLVAALFFITTRQLDTATQRAGAEKRRFVSLTLAESVRKSSDDLSNMVRLYVSTGQPKYRRYYPELLAIRNGYAPRPRNDDGAFWDRVLAGGKAGVRYDPPESLTALMRKARFTAAEFEALANALQTSNRLAVIESGVMRRVRRRIERGVDRACAGDVQPQFERLVDAAYLREKRRIMAAIENVAGRVTARTTRQSDALASRNKRLLGALPASSSSSR